MPQGWLGSVYRVGSRMGRRAAEKFTSVFYPPLFEVSISVLALETFAESGEITDELGFYARFFHRKIWPVRGRCSTDGLTSVMWL
ncbi:MAG: alpha/beta hydrolase [Synechococcaceae cyanobacterium RM1_1_27]|nr:alpha/beta hydrolase [Synechococcaceae cyanobacterium RM1_1_27]